MIPSSDSTARQYSPNRTAVKYIEAGNNKSVIHGDAHLDGWFLGFINLTIQVDEVNRCLFVIEGLGAAWLSLPSTVSLKGHGHTFQ